MSAKPLSVKRAMLVRNSNPTVKSEHRTATQQPRNLPINADEAIQFRKKELVSRAMTKKMVRAHVAKPDDTDEKIFLERAKTLGRNPKRPSKPSIAASDRRKSGELRPSPQIFKYEKDLAETKFLLDEMESKYGASKIRSERSKSTNFPINSQPRQPILEPSSPVYNPNDYFDDHPMPPLPEGVLSGDRRPLKGRSRFTESYLPVQRSTEGDLKNVVQTIREEIQSWKKRCFDDTAESLAKDSASNCGVRLGVDGGTENHALSSDSHVVRLPSERDVSAHHLSPIQEDASSKAPGVTVCWQDLDTIGTRNAERLKLPNSSVNFDFNNEVISLFPSNGNNSSTYPLDKYLNKVCSVGGINDDIVPKRVSCAVNQTLLLEKLELLMREAERLKEPFSANASPVPSQPEDSESGYTEDMVAAEFYKANYATKKTKGITQEKRYIQFFSKKAVSSTNNPLPYSIYGSGYRPPVPSPVPSPRTSSQPLPNFLPCSPRPSHCCHSPVKPVVNNRPIPCLSVAQTNCIEISPDEVDDPRNRCNTFLISVESKGTEKPVEVPIVKSKGFCVQELPTVAIRSPLVRQHFQVINIPPTKLSRSSQNVSFVQIERDNPVPPSFYNAPRNLSIQPNHPPSEPKFQTKLESEVDRIFRTVDAMNEKLVMGPRRLPLLTSSINALSIALGHLFRSDRIKDDEVSRQDFMRKLFEKITVVSEIISSENEILGSQTDDHYERLCLIIDDVVNDIKFIVTSCDINKGGEGHYFFQHDQGDPGIGAPSYQPHPLPSASEGLRMRTVRFDCEETEEDLTSDGAQATASNQEINIPSGNVGQSYADKAIQTVECCLAGGDPADLPRFEKIREINRCLACITTDADDNKSTSPDSLPSSDKETCEESAALTGRSIDRILNETFTVDKTLNYCADFEEITSVSNASQPIQKSFHDEPPIFTFITDREDDQSLPSSYSSAPKTDTKMTSTSDFSFEKTSTQPQIPSPPPPTVSNVSTPGVESSEKLAVRPFVQTVARNVFTAALLSEARSFDPSHFIQHTEPRLTCPTVRLTNASTNTLIEINLPEKSSNFQGSITVDADVNRNEIKLSYDGDRGKLIQPQLRLTNEEETQTSEVKDTSPPVPPVPQTNALTDELKDSLNLITSRMEAMFQRKVNELVESCAKQVASFKPQESDIRIDSPDLSNNPAILSPDLSTPESLLKELNSDSTEEQQGSCHDDREDTPSVLESKKMELEERISERLKILANPVKDKSQQTQPVDYDELFRLTQKTIDELLKRPGITLDASKSVAEDQPALASTVGVAESQLSFPPGIAHLKRLLPETSISQEIEESRVSSGPGLFNENPSEYSMHSSQPNVDNDESSSSTPQNARSSLTDPSCLMRAPNDIDGVRYYDSDLMSEGEIGYAYTSNSYSSGEIKPKAVATTTVVVKNELSVSLERKDSSESRLLVSNERLNWSDCKEGLEGPELSFNSTSTTTESTTSESK